MFGVKTSCDTASIVHTSLNKDKALRYSSAASMLQALSIPKPSETYTIFVSYRVASDALLARLVFDALNNSITPKKNRVTVYLDSVRLKDGEMWEAGFLAGIKQSDIFLPLVSEGFRLPMMGKNAKSEYDQNTRRRKLVGDDSDAPDNVLKELQVAIALHTKVNSDSDIPRIRKILPVWIGKDEENGYLSFWDGNSQDLDGEYPDTVSWPTTEEACSFLESEIGIHLREEGSNWTILQSMTDLLAYPGMDLADLQGLPHDHSETGLPVQPKYSLLPLQLFLGASPTRFIPSVKAP